MQGCIWCMDVKYSYLINFMSRLITNFGVVEPILHYEVIKYYNSGTFYGTCPWLWYYTSK